MADAPRYAAPDVREIRETYWDRMPNTRAAATAARNLLAGKLPIVLPSTVQIAGADAWPADLPHKRMAPQRLRQKLISKLWEIKRPVTAGGPRAAGVATRIAQPLNAIMRDERAGLPWDDVNDILLIEGLVFSTVSVDLADWRKPFSLYGPDGQIASRYAIDGAGKFRGDTGYDGSTVDIKAANADVEAERIDHLARNLPFRQRGYSIRMCAPIWGPDLTLSGLVIESKWSASTLRKRGMYVGKLADGADAQLYPLGATREGDPDHSGRGHAVTVTEVWETDDEGKPYISYAIDGHEYVWKRKGASDQDGLDAHTIDLSKLCKDKNGVWKGFSRLPISWGFGLGWSPSDMDERAMSFITPFLQSWRNIDSIVTSLIMYSQMMACPPLIEKVPFGAGGSDDAGLDDDEPALPDIQPGKITRVTGDITQIMSSGPPAAVFQAVSLLMGENKTEGESNGSGAGSGIQLSLAEAFNEDTLTTIHQSALRIASQNASFVLEGAVILGECYEPIKVYQLADVLLAQTDPSDTTQLMTLDPGLVGTSYDVRAVNVKQPGENPAVRQQNAALVKEGFYDNAWFLEQDGYPAPEAMAARVAYQQLLGSDAGQQATMRMLAQYVEKKFLGQIQELQSGGQANAQGLPTGYADGTTPPPGGMLAAGPQATGGQPGMGTPNPAAAQLGGVIGAGMGQGPLQNIQNAGGALPSAPLQTGGP